MNFVKAKSEKSKFQEVVWFLLNIKETHFKF